MLQNKQSCGGGYRIGSGFDVHPLVPERKRILGGVEVLYHFVS